MRAFEVEHTTSVYSGILCMADLLALQPNMDIKLHIVVPTTKRDKCVRQLGSGSGEGQHTITIRDFRHLDRSESRRPIKRAGSGQSAYVLMGVRRRTRCLMAEHGGQVAPIVTQ